MWPSNDGTISLLILFRCASEPSYPGSAFRRSRTPSAMNDRENGLLEGSPALVFFDISTFATAEALVRSGFFASCHKFDLTKEETQVAVLEREDLFGSSG